VNRVLTIVGASVRAAAQSALRAGFAVCAGDRFADADLRRICAATPIANYPVGLSDVVRGLQVGPWMYTGALENHRRLVESLARRRPLWGNGAAVLARVRNPRLVAEALSHSGLHAPSVHFDPHRVPRDGAWLVKSRHSAGGTRVAFWDDGCADFAPSASRYFQQFIEGPSYSAVYVAARGRAVLLGITRQLTGQPWCGASGFRYCGSIGPVILPPPVADEFARIGHALAARFDLVGLFGVDAVVNAAGVWPVEVNPRYTASMEILERSGGANTIALDAAACAEGKLPPPPEQSALRTSGKAILFAPARLTISKHWFEHALARSLDWPQVADIPRASSIVEAGGPIATVFADADDEATVLKLLRERAQTELGAITSSH
jgi:predicted ATP-grasp superfamily ATP-dependent carboligase